MKTLLTITLALLTSFQVFSQVSLTDPNICWEGVSESELTPGGELRTFRFPKVYATNSVSGYYGSTRATSSAGVAMKIKTSSPSLTVSWAEDLTWAGDIYWHRVAVYKDGVFQLSTNDFDINLTNNSGQAVEWRFVLPVYSQMNLTGITLQAGHTLQAVDACNTKPVYLAIGNSISMGVGVEENDSRFTYSRLVADNLDYELHNWAIGGSKVYDGVLANLSSGIDPSLITVLWGYNDVHFSGNDGFLNTSTLPQFETIIETLCQTYPSANIMVILPIFTLNPTNTTARTIPILSDGQRLIVEDLMNTYNNLCFFDGWDYTDAAGLNDDVHPNNDGNIDIADAIMDNLGSCGLVCEGADLGNDLTLCGVPSVSIDCGLDASGGRTFSWTRDNQPISETSPSFTTNIPGVYKVVADSALCLRTDEVVVSAVLPAVNFGPDVDLCSPSDHLLDAGYTGFGLNYAWSKNGLLISGVDQSTYNVTVAGDYQLTVSASGCNDVSDDILITSSLLEVTNDTVCQPGQDVTLTVAGSGSYEWYDALNGGGFVGGGNSITTPVSTSSTYYVEDADGVYDLVGMTKPTTSGNQSWNNSNFTFRLRFEVMSTLNIDSLSVYPATGGDVVVNVLASDNNTVVDSKTFSGIIAGNENRLPVAFTLSPGLYYMDFTGTSGGLRYSNENDPLVNYPYTITNVISIEGADPIWFQDEGRYPYAYNWRISAGNACDRTPAEAVIDPLHPDCITAIDDNKEESSISIYPNPTDGKVMLGQKTHYEVSDLSGQVLLSGNSQFIDLGELEPNIYILHTTEGMAKLIKY